MTNYKIKLEQFQGPLDLLLQLIEGQKLDISQVALAKVTDQYLAYLDENKEIGATELADFLVVATKLLVIKSKILLPRMADDEEDSAQELEAQLRMYKEYLEAAKKIEELISDGKFLFSREKIAHSFEPTFSPPDDLKAQDLKLAFEAILNRVDYVVNLPQQVMKKVVTLKEKVSNIRELLKKAGKFSFKDILMGVESKGEAVVAFMALLELIKSHEVIVNQKGVFDEIIVHSIK